MRNHDRLAKSHSLASGSSLGARESWVSVRRSNSKLHRLRFERPLHIFAINIIVQITATTSNEKIPALSAFCRHSRLCRIPLPRYNRNKITQIRNNSVARRLHFRAASRRDSAIVTTVQLFCASIWGREATRASHSQRACAPRLQLRKDYNHDC